MSRRLDKVLDYLKDCQLATYIHSFSLFLEPMLAENFESAKLADAAERIEADSLAYRELYTECYDALEASTVGAIDAAMLGGIASAGKVIGRAIAATPSASERPLTRHSRAPAMVSAASTTGSPRSSWRSSSKQRRPMSLRSGRA